MNTNMTGFRWFSKELRPRLLDGSSLSIGRIKSKDAVITEQSLSVDKVMLDNS